ncbi:MAG: BglII/BstYI family type II restriction endonuclease [Pseudomonadota bacterium]
MRLKLHSYRFSQEILQHPNHQGAWDEVRSICEAAPLFIWPEKSKTNKKLDVVQQLMNVYFDRRFAIDGGWEHHPLATKIVESGLRADFRKSFGNLTVQVEVQFGNMARWYSDIFKFQTAYSQGLIQAAISILPTAALARRIDSNVANFERALRELPSAELSITLPILLIGLEPDYSTALIDVSASKFSEIKELTGKTKAENLWRVVNGRIGGATIENIGPESEVGPQIELLPDETGEE